MAFEIGTATDYDDLLDKLLTFLTTDTTLVADGQEWTVLDDDTTTTANVRYVYLQGQGLAGTDEIYINIRQSFSIASDYYNWEIRGATGYNAANTFDTQPGVSTLYSSSPRKSPHILLWDSSISYWFIANGRRFMVIAKVSTVYNSLYAGFYLPYATPSEFPYPIYIAGSGREGDDRWSIGAWECGSCFDPVEGASAIRHFDGAWYSIYNYASSPGARNDNYASPAYSSFPWERDRSLITTEDGKYVLLPAILHTAYSGKQTYGELDGVFYTTGFSAASEDIITVGADDYLVVQSMHRTNTRDYAAFKLE